MSVLDAARFANLLAEDRFCDPVWARLPISEQVSDRLGDLLFGTDEILEILQSERGASLRDLEADIRKVYYEIDQLMRRIAD